MNNIRELRNELSSVFYGLKGGQIQPNTASQLSNACGKIISSLKVELQYFDQRKEKPKIPFLAA